MTLPVDLFVTMVPEVKDFCAADKPLDPTLRLEAVLGLPPASGAKYLVQMWVSQRDLFRPSPDPEISDHEAELDFPVSPTFVTVNPDYVAWFTNRKATAYTGKKPVPWTRLGYTYDWGNSSNKVGLSEFVIRKSSTIEVQSVADSSQYCR